MRKLIGRAQAGDSDARDELIRMHLGLVQSIAARFEAARTAVGIDRDDLFQAGCLGLLKAVDRFDPSYGTAFTTYAFPVIVGEIKEQLRRWGGGRRSPADALRAAAARLEKRLGRPPTVPELASETQLAPADIGSTLAAYRPPLSLDAPPAADPGATDAAPRLTALADDEAWQEGALVEGLALRTALAALSPVERQLVAWRFLRGESQQSVARRFGVSQAYISRWERGLLARLRAWLE
ncbi:MAG TPA: sigma-70 family RNA polymerase sigma factor [Limnochordia bacterium]